MMDSGPDGELETMGATPDPDDPLDYEDNGVHGGVSEDDNETDEEEQMEVGGVEGGALEEVPIADGEHCRNAIGKERPHKQKGLTPPSANSTASEKAKKLIAENTVGDVGGG